MLSSDERKSDNDSPSPMLEKPATGSEELVNASGHKQELDRQFSLLSICSVGITTGNTWIAMGGSLVCHLSPAFRFYPGLLSQ